jgi:hypothetical protein
MTSRYEELKNSMTQRIERMKGIEARLQELVRTLKKAATFNKESHAIAWGSLHPSVIFEIEDVTTSPPQAVGAMGISATKIGTQYIVSLADLDRFLRGKQTKAS